jgi:hypothetical protein
VADINRASDQVNALWARLSAEDREIIERHRAAQARGEHPEYTAGVVAAFRHRFSVLREALEARGPYRPSPSELVRMRAILRSRCAVVKARLEAAGEETVRG